MFLTETYKLFIFCHFVGILRVLVHVLREHPRHLTVTSLKDLKVPVAHVGFVELVSQLLIPER